MRSENLGISQASFAVSSGLQKKEQGRLPVPLEIYMAFSILNCALTS